jgi:thiamine monophosphate synthase
MGVHQFASIARTSEIPTYALGGIDATNARRLRGSRAYGIAAISGFANEIK